MGLTFFQIFQIKNFYLSDLVFHSRIFPLIILRRLFNGEKKGS